LVFFLGLASVPPFLSLGFFFTLSRFCDSSSCAQSFYGFYSKRKQCRFFQP
jgi:hypothetical protein